MADRADRGDRDTIRDTRQVYVHPQQHMTTTRDRFGTTNGPTASQMIALVTLVPVSGTLLVLAGLTLVGSVIGLAVATPLAILFSPVLVPAALLVILAVTGFLSSGAFGLTGLSSLTRVTSYLRMVGERMPEELDYAKRRVADAVAYTGQKTKDVGQTIESKARESGTTGRV
ncbi:oleosin 18.2 kDa-like [Silene latifolia]|uniref:oleosin 18.2 kDa-like n=1 Tax=Silene latifolia TaxID=37657 RepID=UPI003D76FEAA